MRPARHAVHRADHAGTVGIEAEAGGRRLLHRLGGCRQRFALRLARNLASEMGGALIFGDHLLTLRLPAAVQEGMEQAAN